MVTQFGSERRESMAEARKRVAISGLSQPVEDLFDSEYSQSMSVKGLVVSYDDVARRLTSECEVSECCGMSPLHRIRHAVWDTGSVNTVISTRLAESLGFHAVDKGTLYTSLGHAEVPMYMLNIRFAGVAVARHVKAFGSPMANRSTELVLGMDVISRGTLTITNVGGRTRMEFTLPPEAVARAEATVFSVGD